MLKLRTFGGLWVEADGKALTGAAARRRPLALLALLATPGAGGMSRDKLAAYLWPESTDEQARHTLAQTLYRVRRELGRDDLVLGSGDLRLNPEAIGSDYGEFVDALARGELERAVHVYTGPFLDGFFLSDAAEFERWAEDERARLAGRYRSALERLAEAAAQRRDRRATAEWWRRLAALDPLSSQVALRAMNALAAAGDRAEALRFARAHEAQVRQELEAVPNPAVLALAQQLRERPVRSDPPDQGGDSDQAHDAVRAKPTPAREASSAYVLSAEGVSGRLAGRYELERELGRGSTAIVYLARDLKHDRQVAVKLLYRELAATLGTDSFLQEIRLVARFSHPHILPLHDSGVAEETLFFVMPYVEGESLRQRLQREGPLSASEALRIGREVADALSYAHAHGVVHRDIKPENILLESGHAVVSDFGLARAITRATGEHATGTWLAVGTPAYMSPEQASGEREVDGRSDIYSLGCVLYEMLAGQPPFMGSTAQSLITRRLAGQPPALHTVKDGLPEEVDAAISKALARLPGDRFATAGALAEALTEASAAVQPPFVSRRTLRRRWWLAAGTVGVVAASLLFATRVNVFESAGAVEPDPNLLAVAPFDVLAPGLELWREGLVDVLSRTLDGAGPIRTVPPTVVIRRWRGRPDPASAAELGGRLGAGLIVFGTVVGAGSDSVRISASVLDAATRRAIAEVEHRAPSSRMDRLTDSLTVGLLRDLGRTRPLGAVRAASISARPVPALKAFLQGEQYYRRNALDSAQVSYERAIALDSTFALAHRRMRSVLRARVDVDLASLQHALRAAVLNHGLAPRESLLVAADSLYAAVVLEPTSTESWTRLSRRFELLEEAVRRYPDDPEAWLELGEARIHDGWLVGVSPRQALAAFERSIALDPAFAPAYSEHALELSLSLRDPARARRYVAAYLTLNPSDAAMQIIAELLERKNAESPSVAQLLDTASADALNRAARVLSQWPDSAEAALQLYRHLDAIRYQSGMSIFAPARPWLFATLTFRGHLREAYRLLDSKLREEMALHFVELALLNAIPVDTSAAVFARWLQSEDASKVALTLPWWSLKGDTVAMLRVMRQSEALARSPRAREQVPHPARGAAARFARAYLALARHDSTEALRLFLAVPDSLCDPTCAPSWLTGARLLVARGEAREAATLLDRHSLLLPILLSPTAALWSLERGRVAERLGDRLQAIDSYSFVAEVWARADPELRPVVDEARAGLKRLAKDRPRRMATADSRQTKS